MNETQNQTDLVFSLLRHSN